MVILANAHVGAYLYGRKQVWKIFGIYSMYVHTYLLINNATQLQKPQLTQYRASLDSDASASLWW